MQISLNVSDELAPQLRSTEGLSLDEEREWEQYQYLEDLVRLAQAKAHIKLEAV
jgi:hypothetical protein